MTATEPITVHWPGGGLSIGYLGSHRWRVRSPDGTVDVPDASACAAAVIARVFAGTEPGREVAQRAPILARAGDEVGSFTADARMRNGWTYASPRSRSDLGDHALLSPFLARWLAQRAERSWAIGVEPVRVVPLGAEMAFAAFASAADPSALCRRLASVLARRLRESASPPDAFIDSMHELKALGHDLWSLGGELWGADYVTPRAGAGLCVSRGDDDSEVACEVTVRFRAAGSDD